MKKFKKVLLLLVVLFSLTGCTKYMQYDGEKKNVVAPETGQRMVENILCKTTKTEETLERNFSHLEMTLQKKINK